MKVTKYSAAIMILLFLSLTVTASDQSPLNSDEMIQVDVERVIGNHIFYTIYDAVGVEVTEGVVTLTGYATEPYKVNSYIKEIHKKVGAVQGIKTELTILPPSANDDRIRYLLARRIYNDSRLLRYSLDRWPYPIHIIVKNGHVVLEGEVKTKMDKQLIRIKATGLNGVVSVKNNLKVS